MNPFKKDIRPILLDGCTARIPLTKGVEAIIDAVDVHLVDGVNWYSTSSGGKIYARRDVKIGGKWTNIYLHRVLMNAPDNLEVDHRDGNPLNNRRSNLRVASKSQNARNKGMSPLNSSGFKGVHWDSLNQRWRAQIQTDGKNKHIGLFFTAEEAYSAYCEANAEMHGEFGRVA